MLDTTGYLSSFGWQGKGNGLRQGSVSRPLAIPQKRTLSGLGKDRDEAFPFWDHLFAAASKSIKIKVSGHEDEADDDASISHSSLLRTATGILSNRRPILGTPASSGTATPTEQTLPHLGLIATAKRESARKRLYAGFFKGPVLGSDVEPHTGTESTSLNSATPHTFMMTSDKLEGELNDKKRRYEDEGRGEEVKQAKKSKISKQKDTGSDLTVVKKKRRKEKHRQSKTEAKAGDEEGKRLQHPKERFEHAEEKRQRKAAKLERRRKKEERRNAKEIQRMADTKNG